MYFVSYNGTDRNWAEWIAWVIESFGYRTIIQVWDFLPGSVWPAEMHAAVQTCDVTVCVLSPDFLASDYTASEWQSAFVDDPIGKKRKLLPIMVRECQPQGFLKARVWVSLIGLDRENAREKIRLALTNGRSKPQREPNFPGSVVPEPAYPARVARYVFVLEGEYEEYSKERIEALTQSLRILMKDSNVTIREVRKGSMILIVEGRADALDNIRRATRKEKLRVGDAAILACWEIQSEDINKDPIESKFAEYIGFLTRFFATKVDKETARDLAQEVVIQIWTSDRLRYSVLGNTAILVQLARAALLRYQQDYKREQVARRKIAKKADAESRRLDALKLSLNLYSRLGPSEQRLLELYWDARFAGHELTEPLEAQTKAIEERMERTLSAKLETQ